MQYLLLILCNWKHFRFWRKRKKGFKTIDYTKGPGYYFLTNIIGHNPIGKIESWKMKSGKTGIYELIDYKTYHDPNDMIEESHWCFIGYENTKPINECSFKEFLNIYISN